MTGPLAGLRVLEMEAIGPVPWAGMMLADLGAEVIRLDRPEVADMGLAQDDRFQLNARGKLTVTVNVKSQDGVEQVLELVSKADVLLEGLRPGVMERLGLGPDACLERNPALVYGRMTGWGQTGPLAQTVGHDINYIATTGVLHAIGTSDRPPVVPLNIIGDFGGGGMLLLVGILSALFERHSSRRGQVVDAAMVDGTLALMAPILGRWQAGQWTDRREANLMDGGAPFYTTYQTADQRYVAVGAIEPRFYQALLDGLGIDRQSLANQHDHVAWPEMRARFAQIFRGHSRDHWERVFEGTEACVSPVMSFDELSDHPHLKGRGCLTDFKGALHPAAAPRFSRTPGRSPSAPARRNSTTLEEVLHKWDAPAVRPPS